MIHPQFQTKEKILIKINNKPQHKYHLNHKTNQLLKLKILLKEDKRLSKKRAL